MTGGTTNGSLSARALADLVRPGRVHRRVYVDPAIFELEMERIHGRAWNYVGHASQVAGPGDYFCTRIGRRPVVMARDAGGRIHVLHNRCAHRGSMVVADESGTAAEFRCCYHGWRYRLDGALASVPLPEGYREGALDLADASLGMQKVARVDD